METNPSLKPDIGPDGLVREAPVIAYTEKIIEEEQLQLKKYIEENYSKIRDVERELSNLSMEMKLTAGPKKAALEHLRKKIEASNERIHLAKRKEDQAKEALEAASKAVADEEAVKQKLCEDLNRLVQESNNSQYARLEELKRRLELLNPSRASTHLSQDAKPVGLAQISTINDVSTEVKNASQGSGGNSSAPNGQGQQPAAEAEARPKRKTQTQGRGRGIGAVPKGRGSSAAGWTGAGFDVDGRT